MTGPIVTIVDYGMGNIFSVMRAFQVVGAEVVIADTPELVQKAEFLVIPGVGAFKDGMEGLKSRGFCEPIAAYAQSGNPLLGICLGMQMLFEEGEEFGRHAGLALMPGKVQALPKKTDKGELLKVPHIGWNRVTPAAGAGLRQGNLFAELKPAPFFYFVHSYVPVPADPGHCLADCEYGGHRLVVLAGRGNLFGCQFHPEKSGPAGLQFLRNFIRLGIKSPVSI